MPRRLVRRGRPYTVSEPRRLPDFSVAAAERGRCGEETGPWAVYVYPDWPNARYAGMGMRYLVDELAERGFRSAGDVVAHDEKRDDQGSADEQQEP